MEGVLEEKAGRSLSSLPSLAKGLLYMQIHQLFYCGAFIYPGEAEIWELIALCAQGGTLQCRICRIGRVVADVATALINTRGNVLQKSVKSFVD